MLYCHEKGYWTYDRIDCTEYQKTKKKIRNLEHKIVAQYPKILVRLHDLVELYNVQNKIERHYFYKEGIVLALNMVMPRMMAIDYEKSSGKITKELERPVIGDDVNKLEA